MCSARTLLLILRARLREGHSLCEKFVRVKRPTPSARAYKAAVAWLHTEHGAGHEAATVLCRSKRAPVESALLKTSF